MSHQLEVDSIQLQFGLRRILSDIYIKCETGAITGLLGRNGQGKTCLMNVIYGSLEANHKSVRIDGLPIVKAFKQKDVLTYLPQSYFIPGYLSLNRIFSDFQTAFSNFEAHFPEFKGAGTTRIKNLSGGQRRLVEVYLIVTAKSKFSMLDEPFSHLMPVHIDKIKLLINKEKAKKGFFMTDHLYQHLLDLCNDTYILKDGKTHLIKNTDDISSLGYAML